MNAPATPIMTRRAPIAPTTWKPETREFEVVFSTGVGVERFDARGPYTEVLSLSQQWPDKVPFLDAHRHDSLDAVLGFADGLQTVGNEARARVKLSRHTDRAARLAAELSDGNSFPISVGYVVHEYGRETIEERTGRRTKLATKWSPVEISLELTPADRQASIRTETNIMPTERNPAPAPAEPQVAPPAVVERAAGNPAIPTVDAPVSPAVPVTDRAAVNVNIRSIARLASLPQDWTDRQIDEGVAEEVAQTRAFEAMRQRSANANAVRTTTVTIGQDFTDPEIRARTIGEALYARFNPGHKLSEPARPYAYLSCVEIASDCLRTRGLATTGMSKATIIERALNTTSDYALILGDAMGRTLREAYRAAPSGLKLVARQTTARDFKDKHRLQLSEAPRLEKVNEHGEIKSASFAEAKETYKLTNYARIVGITRQVQVNDDLGAFNNLMGRVGQAAASTEATLLVDLVTSGSGNGPMMSDGNALFHTAHGNKAVSGAAPSVTTLTAARTAMRRQVGLKGDAIEIVPKFLLVPPDLETAAEQLLTSLTPHQAADVNPFSGKLALAVEARFANTTRWYLISDPAAADGLEYSYLEGAEGVQVDSKSGFEIDGVQVRARLDFGAGFVDWRSWYVNAGA